MGPKKLALPVEFDDRHASQRLCSCSIGVCRVVCVVMVILIRKLYAVLDQPVKLLHLLGREVGLLGIAVVFVHVDDELGGRQYSSLGLDIQRPSLIIAVSECSQARDHATYSRVISHVWVAGGESRVIWQ